MTYLGRVGGPPISGILFKIGWDKLGWADAKAVDEDISWEEFSESHGKVQPILVDENGEPYHIAIQLNNQHIKSWLLYVKQVIICPVYLLVSQYIHRQQKNAISLQVQRKRAWVIGQRLSKCRSKASGKI